MDVSLFPLLTESDYRLPLYITSAGQWTNQSRIVRPHGFNDYQWIQCMSGVGRLETDRGTYQVESGQGMWLMPNEKHAYTPVQEPWSVRWISFNGGQVQASLETLKLNETGVRTHSNPEMTLQKMEEAIVLLRSGTPRRSADGSVLAYSVMIDLYQWTSTGVWRSQKHVYEQMGPVFQYVEEHYHETVTLEQLAQQIQVTEQHTCLLFRQTTGLRPFEYLTRFRIRKAKEMLLAEPTLPVKDVAKRVGYEHTSYFIKRFKQQEGITPSRFRQLYLPPARGTQGG